MPIPEQIPGVAGSIIEEPIPEEELPPTNDPAAIAPAIEEDFLEWESIASDPRYIKLSKEQKLEARRQYWDSYIAEQPRLLELPSEKQLALQQKFIVGQVDKPSFWKRLESDIKKGVRGDIPQPLPPGVLPTAEQEAITPVGGPIDIAVGGMMGPAAIGAAARAFNAASMPIIERMVEEHGLLGGLIEAPLAGGLASMLMRKPPPFKSVIPAEKAPLQIESQKLLEYNPTVSLLKEAPEPTGLLPTKFPEMEGQPIELTTIGEVEIPKTPVTMEELTKGITEPTVKPIIVSKIKKPKIIATIEPGPSTVPLLARAREEKGLPIVELTEEEFKLEVARGKKIPLSAEERSLGDTISLHAGIPFDEAVALLRSGAKRLGTSRRGDFDPKDPAYQELGPFQYAINALHTPAYLAKVHPSARELVVRAQELGVRWNHKFVYDNTQEVKRLYKGLTKEDKLQVAKLLDNYQGVQNIPREDLALVTPKQLDAFIGIRKVTDSIFKTVKKEGDDQPGYIEGYLTVLKKGLDKRPLKEQQQIIKNFAAKNKIPYYTAQRILANKNPKGGFFGPLSKERKDLVPDELREWDLDVILDFYIRGAARKKYLDELVKVYNELAPSIPEKSRVRSVIDGYMDTQFGVPQNAVERVISEQPWLTTGLAWSGWWQYFSKLTGRPIATLVEATQYPIFDGINALALSYKNKDSAFIKHYVDGLVAVANKRGRQIVKESGITLTTSEDLRLSTGKVEKVFKAITDVTGAGYHAASIYGRTATYIRNWEDMQYLLQKSSVKFTEEEKLALQHRAGIAGVGKTQFFYDMTGKPRAFVGPLGAEVGRFKTYSVGIMERIINMDPVELTIFAGFVGAVGGWNAFPGLRQIYYEMREKHPDSKATKIMDAIQSKTLSGMTGIDLPQLTPIGLVPGGSLETDYWYNFTNDPFATIGHIVGGPWFSDATNIYRDIKSGDLDMKFYQDMQKTLSNRSTTAFNVQVQQIARAMEEIDKGYTKYARHRPGVEVSKQEAILRGFGLRPIGVVQKQQVLKNWDVQFEKAVKEKEDIEDDFVSLINKVPANLKDQEQYLKDFTTVIGKQTDFNTKYGGDLGIQVTPDSIKEAQKNFYLPLEQRKTVSRLQYALLRERLRRLAEEKLESE